MIKELANVVHLENGNVTVTSQIKSSCSGCSQLDTCGSGQVAKALPKPQLTLTLKYNKNDFERSLKVGDCVVLALPEKDIMTSAGQVYLFPLVGLISFSAIGQWFVNQQIISHELIALAIGLFGGYLGFRIAKFKQNYGKNSDSLQPKIVELLPEKSFVEPLSKSSS